jgi:predicted RNase H-like HicB family nuclease
VNPKNVEETYGHYSMLLQWDPDEGIYVVTVPELPGCKTHGATYEEAVAQGQNAIDSWVTTNRAEGRPIPEPQVFAGR